MVVAAAMSACRNVTTDDATASVTAGTLEPVAETAPVAHDPDDPAIWIAPDDPANSLILGTDKQEGQGALYVFGLDGRVRQIIGPLDRPNNVDVEYGFSVGGETIDLGVVTERIQRRLRVFAIPRSGGQLTDLAPAGLPVLDGQAGEEGAPMGIARDRRARDGVIFAIVSPKAGGPTDYLWQYRLEAVGTQVAARFVRRFGSFSGLGAGPGEPGEIEALVVDDRFGFVYYSDERFGIRKWHADPDAAGADTELAVIGQDAYSGDREGLALYERPDGTGFLLASDQVPGGTRLHIYRREGEPGAPHRHALVTVLTTAADNTDGLEATSRALPGFAAGFIAMMNSGPRTFQIYPWERVAARVESR